LTYWFDHIPVPLLQLIVQDDRQPWFPGLALLIGEQHIQQGMVGLPDGIGRVGLTTLEKVEGLVIGLAAVCSVRVLAIRIWTM
jgi:hypothetical protein